MLDFQTYLGLGRSIGPGSDNAGCGGFWSRGGLNQNDHNDDTSRGGGVWDLNDAMLTLTE